MATFNPDFWEIPIDQAALERVPAHKALYYETENDQYRRHAFKEFFSEVRPTVNAMVGSLLTQRQREVVELYYLHQKTQEDIAVILNLSQSTISRHLFGTARGGKKVGGAIPKLRKAVDRNRSPEISNAFAALHDRLEKAPA